MAEITLPGDFDNYTAIRVVSELEPFAGPHAPISPTTFAHESGERVAWREKIALTENMTIPSRESRWNDIRRRDDGSPVTAPAVLINSIGAEAHQLGRALRLAPDVEWGRIEIRPWDRARAEQFIDANTKEFFDGVSDPESLRGAVIDRLTKTEVDSWEASHRTADALIRTAEVPDTGKQVWQGGPLKQALLTADPNVDATWLWQNAANDILFGFWMSNSGTGFRPRWARAVFSEVFGYGVSLVKAGATKTSPIGEVLNDRGLEELDGALRLTTKAATDSTKPSAFGFGQVPGPLGESAVSCEVILRRGGVSLNHLRQLRVADDPDRGKAIKIARAAAAAGMYALAVVVSQPTFLRSGTDLIPVDSGTVWSAYNREGESVDLTVDVETAHSVLKAALDDLEAIGLGQADPICLNMSQLHAELITRAAVGAAADGRKTTKRGK